MSETSLTELVREYRLAKGLGIKTLAPMVGVSYSYLSKIENGVKRPSVELLLKLAKIYEISPDSLLIKAGYLPPDIESILADNGSEAFEYLRQEYGNPTSNSK